jgi:hypothetical protein
MRGAWLLALVASCAYKAGAFSAWGHDFRGRRTTVGCLDVAIERRVDHPTGPVLAYDIGNRCDGAVTVDLARVAVMAMGADGKIQMQPFDPEHELRALSLDGRALAAEAIEYRSETIVAPEELCVDVASLIALDPPNWQCFARSR